VPNIDLVVQDTLFRFRLKVLKLLPVWEWVQANNPSGDLPYHNNTHLYHMARIADQLLLTSNLYVGRKPEVALVLACLFHDFDHSGGKLSDRENIDRAIAGLRWFAETGLGQKTRDRGIDFDEVEALIRVTEFPFIHTPTTELERCIRDADVLYSFSTVGVAHVVGGLRKEIAVMTGNMIEPKAFVEKQREFVNGLHLYTEPGRYLWQKARTIVLDEQIRYIKDTYGLVQ